MASDASVMPELAGRQVGVDVRGYVAGGLGAAALLGDGHVNLALAHAHQREFRDDEERVHQQEEHHEQQAYSGLHTDQSSFRAKTLFRIIEVREIT